VPYTVIIGRTAQRSIGALQQDMRRRIVAAIDGLAATPRPPNGHPLAGHNDVWRVRVGNYRIIYEIDDHAATVTVTRVAHRREAYRGL
jgi:mRNA interferase RelE/StbE